jgi:histidinol dehydrogenase
MPAGPSEIFIIADKYANPTFIAADLLADAEHGPDSAAILLTTSQDLAKKVLTEIEKQLKTVGTSARIKLSLKRFGLIGIVDNVDEAIKFCNDYAPEHLEIQTRSASKIADRINNAGSIFLGKWTTKSAGDYATGSNHILPTGGNAKMFSALSVEDFGRLIPIQKIESKKALLQLKKTVETFGETENLPAHKNSTSIRFRKEQR